MTPVIVAGCGHSGTTLMAVMLGAHPRLHLIRRETGFLVGATPQKIRRRMALWDQQAESMSCHRWVEKTPAHVHHIGRLFSAAPQSLVVLMARDPRDVVASLRARGVSTTAAIKRWIGDNRQVIRWRIDGRTTVVRYEDLVADPESTLRGLLDWMGEEWSDAVLRFHESPQPWNGAKPPADQPKDERKSHLRRRVWQVSQPVFDGRGRWRRDSRRHEWVPELWAAGHPQAHGLGYRWEPLES